ncbi:MAG: GNAT family N-acetyltransferase, partial [Victivallales bacterium]|nr:GNAT family N-acetyltransferase [Victivallales bacterium]
IIDLSSGYDAVRTHSYHAKNRNMIRKAEKDGISCRASEDWSTFRRQYRATMDRLKATSQYYFPPEYYTILRRGFGSAGSCRLLEAVREGKSIASLLLLLYDNFAHYHLSARDQETTRPGTVNLLLDYAIRTAIAAGARTMHLGGGISQDDSLMRFKAGFSPQRGKFHIGCQIHNDPVYRAVCRAWAQKYPEKITPYRHLLLRYRR